MKTSYLPRNRSKNSILRKIFILALIFAGGSLTLSFINVPLYSLASPVWSLQNSTLGWFEDSASTLRSKRSLAEENSELREKLVSYEIRLALYEGADEREADLLELAGRAQESNAVAAGVLIHPPRAPYDTIVIDAGSGHGILADAKVFLPEGPALGYIAETEAKASKVRLYSVAGERTNAVLERHSLPVILIGAGGGSFKLVLPRDAQIEPGDRILTADIEGRLLAVVGDISMKPTDSFKEVLAKSPANIFSLRYVLIQQ